LCLPGGYGTAPNYLWRSVMRVLAAFVSLSLLAGCATTAGTDRLAERDPLEGFNRGVWGFNRIADAVVLKPVTTVYRTITPRPARRGISNVFANLSEPFSFINNMLQGKPKRAINSLKRFVVNSTLGVGGLADPASKMGMKPTREDFGQTLASWGVNGGPYLVLPLLGPSTFRDGVGTGVSQIADPYRVGLREAPNDVQLGVNAGEVIMIRNDLTESGADAFLDASADPYVAARAAYLQRRRAQILDQEDAPATDSANGDAALDAALADIDAQEGTVATRPTGEANPVAGDAKEPAPVGAAEPAPVGEAPADKVIEPSATVPSRP
jgi:phospholipid-binding lipoprotein MlaA